MGVITNIKTGKKQVVIEVKLSTEEYANLKADKYVMLVPISNSSFEEKLTAGKLGTSFRIMLPKKTLEKRGIYSLPKKVNAQFVELNGQEYLIVNLKKPIGIPLFEEGVK